MYIHTDIYAIQSPKITGESCGDAYGVFRDESATTIVLSDGLGSGIRAHIAANMCVSRLIGLIKAGFSLREAFAALSQTMDKAWGNDEPFAVFTVARILNNGQTTVLSYEMPASLLINHTYSQVIQDRIYTRHKAVVHESSCMLDKDEGLILLSDGITQAGMGKIFARGWEIEGVRKFVQSRLPVDRIDGDLFARMVHDKARSFGPKGKGDDCSVVLALNRRGVIVNLLTGPPNDILQDEIWVNEFFQSEGIHLVSGGSTALLAARIKKQKLITQEHGVISDLPSYDLDGCELVTEGIVTLNQVYNLLDTKIENLTGDNPVIQMCYFLKMADKVNIWLGTALNSNDDPLEFRQLGLLARDKIVEKIINKLDLQGKLVVLKQN
jgi:hypothetical protein